MALLRIASFSVVISMFMHIVSCQRDVSMFPHSCQFSQNTTKQSVQSMRTANVEFTEDLKSGWDTFSWTTEYFCILQGVLKVTPPPSASAVKISLNLFNTQAYSFHIADTSGDAGTSGGYDAEMYGENQTLHIYKRSLNRNGNPPHTFIKFFLNYPQVFLNIRITRDNVISFDSKGRSRAYKLDMEGEDMFRFDEMYIGINRLVGNATKFGMGVCGVCVDFDF